jgi:hypothetical protein
LAIGALDFEKSQSYRPTVVDPIFITTAIMNECLLKYEKRSFLVNADNMRYISMARYRL